MLDRMLRGVGVSEDALMSAMMGVVMRKVEPMLDGVRTELLDGITGEAPPSFGPALQKRGWNLSAEQIQILWSAVFEALANAPIAERIEAPALTAAPVES